MSKQEKYLVLTKHRLKELIRVAEYNKLGGVSLRLEAAGKRHPGQLSYTDDFRKQVLAITSGFDTWDDYARASVEEVNKKRKGLKKV